MSGIVSVEALSLWRRANFGTFRVNPLRGSCMSKRSRCGAVRIFNFARANPLPGIMRGESPSLWRRVNFQLCARALCKDRACRNALVRSHANSTSHASPLRGSCVSKRHISVLPCEFQTSAGRSTAAWNVQRILFGIDDHLAVSGGWERWCMERPENSLWNRRLSRGFWRRSKVTASVSPIRLIRSRRGRA